MGRIKYRIPRLPRLAVAFTLGLCTVLAPHTAIGQGTSGTPAEVYRQASEATPDTTLFALGALVCGAGSVANEAQSASLHQMLLDCPQDDTVDARYPMRRAVTAQLRRWPLASRHQARDFLLAHAMAVTNFNALVLQLVGPPPTFAVTAGGAVAGISDSWTPADRQALSRMLQQTWKQANLEALWHTLAPAWQAAQIPPYEVRQVAQQLENYVRLPEHADLKLAYVTVNPMMPAGSGVTSIFADDHYLIILGPATSLVETRTLLAHELAHPLLHAFFHTDPRAQRALQNAQCVYEAVTHDREGTAGVGGVYTGWEVYFSETLVRSISHHLMATTEAADGFILQPTVAWELQRFDAHPVDFEHLMLHCLDHLQNQFCRRHSPAEQLHRLTRFDPHPRTKPERTAPNV